MVEENGHIGHGAVLHACVVRRGALVGIKAVVMDEAEIGEQAMVAACAFVPVGMRVAPRSLVAGIPAKVVRTLGDQEVAWNAEARGPITSSPAAAWPPCARRSRCRRSSPDRKRLPASKVDALIAGQGSRHAGSLKSPVLP